MTGTEGMAIEWQHADLAWPYLQKSSEDRNDDMTEQDKQDMQQQVPIVLRDVNVAIKQGQLIGCCGAVGAGKSTLLSSLLAEALVVNEQGSVAIRGSVAYVSQQAWIQSATLKDNILFGTEYDETRYREVLHAACLEADLEALPAGDETFIGMQITMIAKTS
jgi:ABC-type multidrug transport system fused ATPase/permease subunit